MRKLVGIAIIAFSLLLGLSCAIALQQELLVAIIALLVISLPLYIIGQIIRTSKYEFKQQGKRWVASYLFFFFILPLLIYVYGFYTDLKESTFIDEQFIIYELSSGMLGEFFLVGFLVLVVLVGARFLNPELKRKGLLNAFIIGTAVFTTGFSYLMFSDYRGIHEEKGLVSSNWKGETQNISYDEIEGVYIMPTVHYASPSNTSDETRFVWRVIFQPSHQNEVVYHFPMLTELSLEQTMAIKKRALETNVPVMIGEMNEETLKWFDIDLELEGLEKERYYDLFQVRDE